MKVSIRNGKGSLAHNERDSELMKKEKQNDKHTLGYSHINEDLTQHNMQLFTQHTSEERIEHLALQLRDSFEEWNSHQKNKDRHKPTDLDELKAYVKEGMRETIFQIGNMEEHSSPQQLVDAFGDYYCQMIKFNPNIRIIGATLHLDEATPHIHFDWVPLAYDFKLREGQKHAMPLGISNKAFEQMGYEVPKKDRCRTYNPLSLFTKASQETWDRCVEAQGFVIDKSSRGTVQKHIDKASFIKETLAAQESVLLDKLDLVKEEFLWIVQQAKKIAYEQSTTELSEEYAAKVFGSKWQEIEWDVQEIERQAQELDDFGLF